MDWNAAIEDNRRMLRRIVALLFALAALAERLTGLPRPVRAFVLRILRSAEATARDFVLETTLDGVSAPPPAALLPAARDAPHDGDSPDDAMRLAQSFRLLAVLLEWLVEGNPWLGKSCIAPDFTIAHLLARMSLERSQLFAATAPLAVGRRDSS